jgi:xanthosine utilization system XapX-like protein
MAAVTPIVVRTRLIGGGILVATGLVWLAQGTGLIQSSSPMTGQPVWAVLGLVGVVVGVAIITWAWRARGSDDGSGPT